MSADLTRVLRRTLAEPLVSLAGLALPLTCGGCGRPGPRWCADCLRELAVSCIEPSLRAPDPPDAADIDIPVFAAASYAGAVKSGVRAFKDAGRRDLVVELAPLMTSALIRAMDLTSEIPWVTPAPSSPASRRARGDVPTHLLVRAAMRGAAVMTGREAVWAPVLRHRRRVVDQAGLGRRDRARNLHGALCVGPGTPPVTGRTIVVADDVVTTGATVRECIRAVREAGGVPVAVSALALTPSPSDVSKRAVRRRRTLA